MTIKASLSQAIENALEIIGEAAPKFRILEVIKQNDLFEFMTVNPKLQLDILMEALNNEHSFIRVRPGIYDLSSRHSYIQETGNIVTPKEGEKLKMTKKIFISHSSYDKEYAKEIVNLLLQMGVSSRNINCSSLYPYGVKAGLDIFEWMKQELNDNAVVICLLSSNYYESAPCTTELGAAWILSKTYIPLLIPPTNFEDIKGIPQSYKAFKINDNEEFNYVKDAIVDHLELPFDERIWEGLKKEFINKIALKLETI
ncbi:toll/interleukin-1 receptor domain-containing protein [Priestia megaterium]|uniref:toll/interleukin-1 receptor domain-containing protein n=1 Tax=Priestia megaterium TaxID=1404 RepID=UPI0034E238D6